MKSMYYRLNPDYSTSPCDLREARREDNWRVALDDVNGHTVSTVFLALDHQHGDGPPLIFETMIFPKGQWGEVYCARYSTYAEAVAGHAVACEHARALPSRPREITLE